MAIQLVDMPVTKIVQETPDTRTFRLVPPANFDFNWKPGQFITINLPDDPKTRRAYSLSSSPLDGHFLDITIKHMGGFGAHVYGVATEGTMLQVIAPRGKFLLPTDPEIPVMLISGGSGVTPYRSMMRYLVQKKMRTRVVNLYSVRVPADIIFKDEFETLCRLNANYSFFVTCTRVPPEDPSWTGLRGRVNPEMIRRFSPDFDRAVHYLCGSHDFITGMTKMLHDMGLPKERIAYEDWG
jgi:ferredoxin-NADP reductase